jgi:hypothetical protein
MSQKVSQKVMSREVTDTKLGEVANCQFEKLELQTLDEAIAHAKKHADAGTGTGHLVRLPFFIGLLFNDIFTIVTMSMINADGVGITTWDGKLFAIFFFPHVHIHCFATFLLLQPI